MFFKWLTQKKQFFFNYDGFCFYNSEEEKVDSRPRTKSGKVLPKGAVSVFGAVGGEIII